MAAIEQLDTENADRDLTSQVTVLTDTPDASAARLCQASIQLGDGTKDLDGTGGVFEIEISVDGNTINGGVEYQSVGTAVRVSLQSQSFIVPANTVVLVKLKSPNAADTDVDVTAYLYDVGPAVVAADLPANFSSTVISGGGAVDSLVQGVLNTTMIESTAGNLATNFEAWFDNLNVLTVNSLDSIFTILGTPNDTNIATDLLNIDGKLGTFTDLGAGATVGNNLADMAGATFSTSTDSLEAIRNNQSGGSLITGTADSGTTTTMVDSARTEADNDYWNGGIIKFTSGNLNGQSRLITDFVASTDTITFAPATTQAVTVHTYELHPAGQVNLLTATQASIDAIETDTNSLNDTKIPQTLNLTASGNIGIDWANVENPTTALDLSATDIQLCDTVTTLTGHTAQTGDTFALANGATGFAAIDTVVDTILVDTADMQPKLGTITDLGAGATVGDNLADMAGATFSSATDSQEALRDRGDSAWTTGAGGSDRLLMADTTIATLASQTSFTLTAGSTDDDAYNGCTIVIQDASTAAQKARGIVDDYAGSTKTITLLEDPGVFTMAATDKIYILAESSLKPTTVQDYHVDVSSGGNVGIDWGNVANPTTALDLSGTDIQLCDTVTTLTGHTAQTGDTFALANGAAGFVAIDTVVDAILVDTADMQPKLGTLTDLGAGATVGDNLADIAGATFSTATDSLEAIRDRGDAAWITGAGGSDRLLLADTTIATYSSQTSFTLTSASADDDAYNGCTIVIEDASTAVQKTVGVVDDYTGSTKTVTLLEDPGGFTYQATDKVYILAEKSLKPSTKQDFHVDVTSGGNVGIDWGNVANPTTSLDLSGTDIQLCDTVTTLTGHTVQTGDTFALANGAAGFVAIDTVVDAILVDTGTTIPATITTAQNDLDILTGADGVNLLSATQASIDAIETDTSTTLQAELDGIQADTEDIQTQIGTAGAGLTAIPAHGATTGTADSGSTTTMVDAARTETDDDYWKGGLIKFTSGTVSGQTRLITGFTASTDTLTFEPATTQAVGTNTYELLPFGRVDLLAATQASVDAIESDTNELQADDYPTTLATLATAAALTTAQNDLDIITGADVVNLLSATQASIDAIEVDTGTTLQAELDGIQADTEDIQTQIGTAGAGLTDLGGMSTAMKAEVNAEADTALTDYDALVPADLPSNFSSLVITAGGAVDSLVQGFLDNTIAETTADNIAANFETFWDNADALTTKTADDVGGGAGGLTALASGTAQSGTSSTIVLAAASSFADDELNWNVVKITSGTGSGQSRMISDYTGSTDTATVTPDLVTDPDSSSVYEVVEGAGNAIQALTVTTQTELAAVPAATATVADMMGWMYILSRNKLLQTASVQTVRDDADGADIATAATSDNGVTFTRAEYV